MRRPPHLFVVARPVVEFASLFAALRQEGSRGGFLRLAATPPGPVPDELATAAAGGALRAVAVGAGRSVAVKPLAGPAVIGDLLREHFRGCAVVLVAGEEGAAAVALLAPAVPRLDPDGEGWVLDAGPSAPRRLSTADLLAHLRRPAPRLVSRDPSA